MKYIVPHNPDWAAIYSEEAARLAAIFGKAAIAFHHMGSTAIPHLQAKPVIDMLIEARTLPDVDASAPHLTEYGYDARGEYGISGRRYFKKQPRDTACGFHVHAYLAGSYQIRRHLAFRDYLICKPDIAGQYAALKSELSFEDGRLKPNYQDAKKAFVCGTSLQALDYFQKPS